MAFPEMMSASASGKPSEKLRPVVLDADFSVIDVTHMADAEARGTAAELLKLAGLKTVFSAAGPLAGSGLSLSDLRDGERKRAVKFATDLIDEALVLDAKLIFVISGPDPGPERRAAATAALRESLGTLCSYAQTRSRGRSLAVALEPSDRTVQHRQLVGPHAEAAALASELRRDHDNFGLVIDLSHIHELGEEPGVVLRLCRDSIRHIHLSNTVLDDQTDPLYGDQHPPFGTAGGRVGVPELAAFIRLCLANLPPSERGRPSMSLEIKARPGQDSEVLLAAGKRAFFDAWALVEARQG